MEIIIFTLIASYQAHRRLERAVAASLQLAEHLQGAGRTAEGFAARQHILTKQAGLVPMPGERIFDQRNLQAEWRTVLVTSPKK
jgi:hypothetical protein